MANRATGFRFPVSGFIETEEGIGQAASTHANAISPPGVINACAMA
jgi:hypothetical protein